MTDRARRIVEAFFAAYGSRDPVGVAALVSDDIEWRVTGPVEVMSFCGHWRGKLAVMRMLKEFVPGVFEERTMVNEELLLDGDRAAAIAKLTGIQRHTRRVISYSLAHFIRLEGDQIVDDPHAGRQPQRRRATARPRASTSPAKASLRGWRRKAIWWRCRATVSRARRSMK